MKKLILILVILLTGVANAQTDCNPLIQDGCDVTDPNVSEFNFGGCAAIAANNTALEDALLNGGTATTSSTRKAELEGLSRNGIQVVITDAFIFDGDGNEILAGFNESYYYDGEVILDKYDDAQTRVNGTNLGDLSQPYYKFWYDSTANRVRDLVAILL